MVSDERAAVGTFDHARLSLTVGWGWMVSELLCVDGGDGRQSLMKRGAVERLKKRICCHNIVV